MSVLFEDRLRSLLEDVASGKKSTGQAIEELRHLPFESIGFASIDQHRQLRQGFPEVIFCPGKTAAQIAEIARRLRNHNDIVLATRVDAEQAAAIVLQNVDARHYTEARSLVFGKLPDPDKTLGKVSIVTAGTADLPVANECELTLKACGIETELISDVGVAGLHRLLNHLPGLKESRLCIVMAGMDGVLSSVVGGLLSCPVIACPTSIGYGSSFEGLSALLTMLNSCAAGLTVVNIDNGFGAAVAAFRILKGTK